MTQHVDAGTAGSGNESAGEVRRERSPGIKLLLVSLIGLALVVPLMLVYALVWDRQSQSQTAQGAINAGWGGPQVIAGPLVVVPYKTTQVQNEQVDGKTISRTVDVEKLLYISPAENRVTTGVNPQERRKSIYRSVLYEAQVKGAAKFALPADLPRFGVTAEALLWDRAELRIGVSDARGLTKGGTLIANGQTLVVQPGKGPGATSGQGFFAFLPWSGQGVLKVDYAFGLRGSRSLSLVPRGGQTRWDVSSSWGSPSFSGAFLPEKPDVSDKGFRASYTVDKLALGQAPVSSEDSGPPAIDDGSGDGARYTEASTVAVAGGTAEAISGQARGVTVGLVEPVNLYSKVDRSVKYGFLFIGFTFLAFLLFDIVGGARVAAAEYLLTGAGLVLFFVLLNLEAWSLLIGSVLLFLALAGVMYATRKVDWGSVGRREVVSG